MTTPDPKEPEELEPSSSEDPADSPSSSPPSPPSPPRRQEPLYQSVSHWMPHVVTGFGLLVIGYEAAFDRLDRPGVIAAGLALAIGGKLSDILRTGGL